MPRRALRAILLLGLCAPALAGAADPAAVVRTDYMLRCQGCHLPDGSGYPGKVPDLRLTLGPFLQVEGGRDFLLRVPGAALSVLDDARLAAVMNWMVAEFVPGGPPPGFAPYDAGEAARLRGSVLSDVNAARAPLAARAGLPPAY